MASLTKFAQKGTNVGDIKFRFQISTLWMHVSCITTLFFLLGRHISPWNLSDWIEVLPSATVYSCMGHLYRTFRGGFLRTCAVAVLRASSLLRYASADMLLYVSSAAISHTKILTPWRWLQHVVPNNRQTYAKLHCVEFQNAVILNVK
jgi:hypothetical protein